jgi:hypothetical protein
MKLQKQKLQKQISAQETCFTQDFVWGIHMKGVKNSTIQSETSLQKKNKC